MPALSNAAHFLNLIVDSPQVFAWPAVQALTGFDIVPFSETCTAADINFPDDKYAFALAFFNAYKTFDTSAARSKLLQASKDSHGNGRVAIKAWVTANWKTWDISDRVAKALEGAGFEGFRYHHDTKDALVRHLGLRIYMLLTLCSGKTRRARRFTRDIRLSRTRCSAGMA